MDLLSGGGRQVLASYTAFSYQGNFSDVACRLMDTLPHQSPAVGVSTKVQQYDELHLLFRTHQSSRHLPKDKPAD